MRQRMLSLKMKDNPQKSKESPSNFNDADNETFSAGVGNDHSGPPKCVLCDETDHVPTKTMNGRIVVNYFACQKFAEFMSPLERLKLLQDKGLCYQCLNPGAKLGHKGNCYNKFNCPHDSHKNQDHGYHVLVCNEHKANPENLELLRVYKERHITKPGSDHRDFSRNIDILGFHVGSSQMGSYEARKGGPEHAIYQLQTISVKGKQFNLFFDSGCGDFICRKKAADILVKLGLAKKIYDGPLYLTGVGDLRTKCEGGVYSVKIPLHDGTMIELTGLCLDKITGSIPMYSLKDAEKDVHGEYKSQGGNPSELPKLPSCVGGETDLMIGMQYLKYFPKEIFQLESGLTLYESKFKSHDGSRGIICGPHKSFTDTNMKVGSHVSMRAYFTEYVRLYQCDCQLRNQVSLIGATESGHREFESVESRTIDNHHHAEDQVVDLESQIGSAKMSRDLDVDVCKDLNSAQHPKTGVVTMAQYSLEHDSTDSVCDENNVASDLTECECEVVSKRSNARKEPENWSFKGGLFWVKFFLYMCSILVGEVLMLKVMFSALVLGCAVHAFPRQWPNLSDCHQGIPVYCRTHFSEIPVLVGIAQTLQWTLDSCVFVNILLHSICDVISAFLSTRYIFWSASKTKTVLNLLMIRDPNEYENDGVT